MTSIPSVASSHAPHSAVARRALVRAVSPTVWRPTVVASVVVIVAAWIALALLPGHGTSAGFTVRDFTVHWAVMSIAMMLPGLLPALPSRSTRNAAVLAAGYLVPWLVAAPLAWVIGSQVPTPVLFLAAAAWQVAPWRSDALLRCPDNGIMRGAWCLLACGPLMLALTAVTSAAHATAPWAGVVVMAIATVAMLLERRGRAMTWEIAVALLVGAAVLLGGGAVDQTHIGHHAD
jgi:hypothetical protein